MFRYFGKWHMCGYQSHTQFLGRQNHQCFFVVIRKPIFQKLGMPRKTEFLVLNAVFIDGKGYQHINFAI